MVCLLPMLNVLARILSSTEAIIRNEVLLWPKGLDIEAYRFVLTDSKYTWSLAWTAILTRNLRLRFHDHDHSLRLSPSFTGILRAGVSSTP